MATGGRVVAYAERDAYAAACLLARMEEQTLEPAPVWCGDITDLPLAPFRGVDAIIGGFPCTDISAAGRRAGIEGEHSGLWGRAFVPAIRELRPRLVFVENVSALLTRGLDTVLGDLAALGYDAEWTSLRASDVGAPHRRERVFILGHAKRARLERLRSSEPRGRPEPASAGIFPPGPDDDWRGIPEYLWPSLERDFRDAPDGLAAILGQSRADALRCIGNGVVALQAAVAARLLLRRLA